MEAIGTGDCCKMIVVDLRLWSYWQTITMKNEMEHSERILVRGPHLVETVYLYITVTVYSQTFTSRTIVTIEAKNFSCFERFETMQKYTFYRDRIVKNNKYNFCPAIVDSNDKGILKLANETIWHSLIIETTDNDILCKWVVKINIRWHTTLWVKLSRISVFTFWNNLFLTAHAPRHMFLSSLKIFSGTTFGFFLCPIWYFILVLIGRFTF